MGHAMKNLFAKMNMEPKDALYTTSSTTSVNLAARGFGITFLPEGRNPPHCPRGAACILHRRQSTVQRAAAAFI